MPKKRRKAIVTQERNIRTYAELWHASKKVLEVGLREPVGSSWQFLSSLVLTAFAFEAYMNHVGIEVLSCWENLERLSPSGKLELLCEVLDVKLPGGKTKRPVQTISQLLRFRNTLAHGRSHTIKAPAKRMDPEWVDDYFKQRLLTDWEKLIKDSAFAKRARKDVEIIVKAIHAARPEPKDYPFIPGIGTGSATLEEA
jgi:hypothetical protein